MRERWLAQGANLREWRRLWAALELADDFQFFAVHVDDKVAADCLGELLVEHCREQGLECPSFTLTPSSTVTELLAWLRAAPRPRVFWLTSDGPADALAPLFLLLNQKREVISETAGAPLVSAMHPMLWAEFRRQAPDFWSIHQSVFRFAAGGARLEFAAGLSAPGRRAVGGRPSVPVRESEPGEPTPLVGRETEVRWLMTTLQRRGARILITGPGGIGKSALLRHVRPKVAQHYPDGVHWVKLDSGASRSAETLTVELLEDLVAWLLPGAPRAASLEQLYKQYVLATEWREALFVFEDVEDPELLPYLVPGASSSVVVSSRQLYIGERSFDAMMTLGPLSIDASVELLDGLSSDADVRQLAMQAGGNPLALLLTRALGRSGDDPKDLHALAELVLARLSPESARLWPKLGLFHGRFTTEDALRLSNQDAERWATALVELADSGLLDRDTNGFRFHDVLRPLAHTRLLAQADQRRTWQAFSSWMATASSEAIDVRDADAVSRWVQGIDGRLSDDDWVALSDAFDKLMALLPNDGALLQLVKHEAKAREDWRMQASCYHWAAQRAASMGDMDAAWAWHGREVTASCEAFGPEHEAVVAGLIAQVSVATPAWMVNVHADEVRDAANRAVAISRKLGRPKLIANALITRGAYESEIGGDEQGKRDLDEGLGLLGDDEGSDRPLLRKGLWALARIACARGEERAAWAAYERLLALTEDRSDRARVYYAMGELADSGQDKQLALEYFGHALDNAGDVWLQSDTYDRMADIASSQGDLIYAAHLLERALVMDQRLGDAERAARTAHRLAEVSSLGEN